MLGDLKVLRPERALPHTKSSGDPANKANKSFDMRYSTQPLMTRSTLATVQRCCTCRVLLAAHYGHQSYCDPKPRPEHELWAKPRVKRHRQAQMAMQSVSFGKRFRGEPRLRFAAL